MPKKCKVGILNFVDRTPDVRRDFLNVDGSEFEVCRNGSLRHKGRFPLLCRKCSLDGVGGLFEDCRKFYW